MARMGDCPALDAPRKAGKHDWRQRMPELPGLVATVEFLWIPALIRDGNSCQSVFLEHAYYGSTDTC
jgi:hypothetical protein